ncbi:hypothetical protein Sjap_001394 [Stephania japonica]|uniref:acylphosphatase n=1 Tax=Stephania japonica TaxID=461633 RepID=A0AAP0KM60_9MAGN
MAVSMAGPTLPKFLPIPTTTLLHSLRIHPRITHPTLPTPSPNHLLFSSSSMNTTTSAKSQTEPPLDQQKTVRAVIKGRVQGVFYRNWTIENARGLGLRGWVRNRRDGSVEALFSGKSESVDEMEQRCRRGPPDALVTSLQVSPSDDDPGRGFDRRPTV